MASDHAFGSCGGILIINWRTGLELEAVEALNSYRRSMLSKGGLRGAIHVAEEGMSLPAPAARAAAEASVKDPALRAAACALVVCGTGFGASAVRSLGTAIFALRSGPPTRVFSNLPEGCTWLLKYVDSAVLHQRLVEACTAIRQAAPRGSVVTPR